MILVLNFFLKDSFAATFNQVIQNHLADTPHRCHFIRVTSATTAEQVLSESKSATHLILSGSEASTLNDMGWEDEMKKVVLSFMKSKKPILGICYGHQFLVRSLAGKDYLRKAPKPEMGWGKLHLEDNPLFEGIKEPVCLLAHYDEVMELPADFHLLGSSEKCAIQGFQYKNLPIWGVQFHPEYDIASGQEIFDDLETNDARYHEHYENALDHEHQLQQNKRFFTNFVNM